MNLRILSAQLRWPFQVIDYAIASRALDEQLWIIEAPRGSGEFVVCVEDDAGPIPAPACMAFFAVFTETDRFTDPYFRVNLGPGVWPTED